MAVICIITLVLATFYVGGAKMWGTTYDLHVAYQNVGGLEIDAPVHFAGLEIGTVKMIKVMNLSEKQNFPGCSIIVTLELDKSVLVKTDSKISIKTLGFMGLKYIDISPGTEQAETISSGSTVKGQISQDMNDVMDSVGEIVDQIKPRANSIVTGIDNIVGENGSLQTTIADLKKLINDADELIVVNKEDVRKMISNLSVASTHLKGFAEEIEANPWKLLIKTPEKKKKGETQQKTSEKPKDTTKEKKSIGKRETRQSL
jgi:phospholipid/cholesterol/gamma-HCH transport system substrate-binding protein